MDYQCRICFTSKVDDDSDDIVYMSDRFVVDLKSMDIILHKDTIPGMESFTQEMTDDVGECMAALLNALRNHVEGLPVTMEAN